MNLVDELFAVTRALRETGVDYAVCGGIAVTIHGYSRFTDDIDLLVKADDARASSTSRRRSVSTCAPIQ